MALPFRKRVVFAAQETVSIPTLGVAEVMAKVDTGAYTGALHCEGIRVKKDAKGKEYVQFYPVSKNYPLYKTSDFKVVNVTSASGHRERRYAVPVTLKIQGKTYKGYIGLTNRADLRYSMLIGRRFLQEHNILVDVTIEQNLDDHTDTFWS